MVIGGSSPLARGTEQTPSSHCSILRFIPAGAGNSPAGVKNLMNAPVHPRWRGEQLPNRTGRPISCGSSPLARGTDGSISVQGCKMRFIPAGAGNRNSSSACLPPISVHPRWRGEQIQARPFFNDDLRFIPAGAGNRPLQSWLRTGSTVHPRWRGEQVRRGHFFQRPDGSSPLARGTVAI